LITEHYPIDPGRVFVTGMSNGGKMSLRLACEKADIFGAAAPVIAAMPADLRCEPAEPISILVMNGTSDPLVPWEGGYVKAFGRSLGAVWSTPRTVEFWVEHNHCDPDPERSNLPDTTPSDGSRIEIARYQGCQESERVTLYSVRGGGHTWPGGIQYLPKFLIGKTNRDAHAGALIWNFFQQVSEQ
jgi:polyhydroxybutyrate depolymerase